jgi:regulator of RNase E activity RraA
MSADMKPIFEARIAGRAVTALLRPVLKSDNRKYPNYALEILDQAPVGSVLVYVMQDGIDIAAMGNLMGTTAKVRNLAGAAIDGAVRDVMVHPGDYIVGDADGIVVVPAAAAEKVIALLKQYDDKESSACFTKASL